MGVPNRIPPRNGAYIGRRRLRSGRSSAADGRIYRDPTLDSWAAERFPKRRIVGKQVYESHNMGEKDNPPTPSGVGSWLFCFCFFAFAACFASVAFLLQKRPFFWTLPNLRNRKNSEQKSFKSTLMVGV